MNQPVPVDEENNEDLLQQTVDFQMKIRRLEAENLRLRTQNQQHIGEKGTLRNQVNSLRSEVNSLKTEQLSLRNQLMTRSLSQHQFRELNRICGFDSSWKLLFRGSEHGFKASTFHARCDNIRGTLLIVKTDKNHVFGGWNPARWNEKPNGYFKSNGTWVFGFIKENNNQEKILKIDYNGKGNGSIYCHPSHSATFGCGHSIVVVNNCNINGSSYTNLSQGFPDGGRGAHVLNGGTSRFKVLEYEVFSK